MQKITFKEFFQLLILRFAFELKSFWEYLVVIFKYYLRNRRFAKIDLRLLKGYFMNNPFRISRKFLLEKGESEIYAYGETPLTTMELISKECGITSKDKVYELGCGRGRACFWLKEFVGCEVVGIDFVPEFIQRANEVKEHFRVEGVEFIEEDFLKTNFSDATLIYLYGTCLKSAEIHSLIKRIQKLNPGVKVITVSFSLTDYLSHEKIKLIKTFVTSFEWGKAEVFLCEIN